MESIIECFCEIKESQVFVKTKDQAAAILKMVINPDFIIMLMLVKAVIAKTKILTDELQKNELNILDAKMITSSIIKSFEQNRTDENSVHREIDVAIKICNNFEIDAVKMYEVQHRRRLLPARFDDKPETACNMNLHPFYTQQLNCVMDVLIHEMNDNLLASWVSIDSYSLIQQYSKTIAIKNVEKLLLRMPSQIMKNTLMLIHFMQNLKFSRTLVQKKF